MSSSITDIPGSQQSQAGQLNPAHQERVQKILQQIPPGAAATAARQPALEELLKPVQRVNDTLRAYGVEFELSQQHDGRVITRLVDRESGDMIRQIPSDAVLQIIERLEGMQQGIILNEEA